MNLSRWRYADEFFNWPVLLAVALFSVNNWWLKYEFHNWATGKLSDLLFCFFFPLYCSAALSILTNWNIRTRILIGACLTLVSLTAMKTSSLISSWVTAFFTNFTQAAIGQDSVNIVDPSDLMVAPVVICSVLFALKQNDHIC